jgi:phosphinothricin acetyltransferase
MTDVITIELALAGDIARIAELANRAAESGSANFATEPEPVDDWQHAWESTRATHPWLVARSAGQVLGFAKASPHRARGAYQWTAEMTVYIDEVWHGRRIGSSLYAVLIPLLDAQGYALLLAGITAGHLASERLHATAGFTRCGTFHRAGWKLGAWHDVGYWELVLQPNDGAPAPIRGVDETWAARAVRPQRRTRDGIERTRA